MKTYIALGCPWCDSAPTLESCVIGGGKRKRMVGCYNDDCKVMPSVTGRNSAEAIERWNDRARAPSLHAVSKVREP